MYLCPRFPRLSLWWNKADVNCIQEAKNWLIPCWRGTTSFFSNLVRIAAQSRRLQRPHERRAAHCVSTSERSSPIRVARFPSPCPRHVRACSSHCARGSCISASAARLTMPPPCSNKSHPGKRRSPRRAPCVVPLDQSSHISTSIAARACCLPDRATSR
jgi:hypothetical protein